MQIPNGTGPGVRRSKRPLLASRTRCNVQLKPPKFGNKVKIGIKVQFGNNFANWCNIVKGFLRFRQFVNKRIKTPMVLNTEVIIVKQVVNKYLIICEFHI